MIPDFLAIGYAVKDLNPDGFTPGGTVVYGAATALGLGLSPAIVTSVGPDLDLSGVLPGVPVHNVPSPRTTAFRNDYAGGTRTQYLERVAGRITPADVPPEWAAAPLVLLGPLAGEVSEDFARHFPGSLVVASLQGWLRQRDRQGRVLPRRWDGNKVLPYVDAAVVGAEDVGDDAMVDRWAGTGRVLIVTMGESGSRLHWQQAWHEISAFPATRVDPTGAGDVFSAAYLTMLKETREPLAAARFASCAASFCVEAVGVAGVPTLAQVRERLKD